ncbi:hypothetical protein [Microcoleus sp. Pol10D4]
MLATSKKQRFVVERWSFAHLGNVSIALWFWATVLRSIGVTN